MLTGLSCRGVARADGMTFAEIGREYDVTAADIRAAIQYAEELVEQEVHYPLPA